MSETHQLYQPPYRAHTYRVFLSSTSKDLKDHRALVTKTLLRLDQFPDDMAYFGAWGDGDAAQVSLAEVASADIYILLVAWRYGTILPHETQSITHLEYLEALRQQALRQQALRQRQKRAFSIFVFLADDSTQNFLSDPNALFPASMRDPEHWDQLIAFRAEVGEHHVCDMFTTPDDLGLKVATALNRELLHRQYDELTRTPRVPYYLPPLPPNFVGRERELDDLCRRLRAGTSVGLSAAVSGMAGVGKSALAAQALHRLASETPAAFPGGITWVACNERSGTTGLAWVYDRVLEAWDASLSREEVAQADGEADPALARERAFQRRFAAQEQGSGTEPGAARSTPGQGHPPKLVLLDNVEEALALARALSVLSSAGITALVTARHRPMLPALSLLSLDTLEHEPETAVTLFAERYTQAGGQWDATRDTPAAQQVVALLGYLPLAIELEAARTVRDALSVAALAAEAREADRLGRLRDPLDPTRSVRYAFERSVATLSDAERHCFTALGMLAVPDAPRSLVLDLFAQLRETRGTNVKAAGEVGDSTPSTPLPEVAEKFLAALSVRSLVTNVDEASQDTHEVTRDSTLATLPNHVANRVRVHPLLHEFAQEHWKSPLAQQNGSDVIALLTASVDYIGLATQNSISGAAHMGFAMLERDETLLAGAVMLVTDLMERIIESDVPHVEKSARMLDEGERTALANRTIYLVDALHDYIDIGGHWRFGLEIRSYQLRLRRELSDRIGEAATLNDLGNVASALGSKKEALQYYEEALTIAREVGDRASEGAIRNNLGNFMSEKLRITRVGKVSRIGGAWAESLDIYPSITDDEISGIDEVWQHYEAARVIMQAVGDRPGEGTVLNNLGNLSDALRNREQALQYYEEALTIAREVGDRASEGAIRNNLGNIKRQMGHLAEALQYYEEALTIAREVGDGASEGVALGNIGSIEDIKGERKKAQQFYQAAMSIFLQIDMQSEAELVKVNYDTVSSPYKRKLWRWLFGV